MINKDFEVYRLESMQFKKVLISKGLKFLTDKNLNYFFQEKLVGNFIVLGKTTDQLSYKI